jgi:hypothetical protein
MEQAQLVASRGPDLLQHRWVQARVVRNDLVRMDTRCPQTVNEGREHRLIDLPRPWQQGVADQTITIRRSGIDRQQQRQISLVHLVDAQNAREVATTHGW